MVPVHRVDEEGQVTLLGTLYPLVAGEFAFAPLCRAPELHPGLPWFLQDMRVQGFTGRAFAQHVATTLGLASRVPDWDDDAHLTAMALVGDDLSGNLVVGDASLKRFYQQEGAVNAVQEHDRSVAYARLADAILDGPSAPSVGGEQPKFCAHIMRPDGTRRSVIVKFSPPGADAAATRWRDLLRAEHAALSHLQENGVPAAESAIVEGGGRVFLEVTRFDRCGDRGRRGLLSLAAVDDHFVGRRRSWSDTAMHLLHIRKTSSDQARVIRLLDTFGALIANTDRHMGNLSFFANALIGDGYALAPVYDMLPMAYRPTELGEVRAITFRPPMPTATNTDVWKAALTMAISYWRRLVGTTNLSAEMREISATNAQSLATLLRLPPPSGPFAHTLSDR